MDFKRDFLGIPRSSIGFQEGYPTISFGSIGIPIGFRKDFLSITRHSKGFQEGFPRDSLLSNECQEGFPRDLYRYSN